MSQSKGLATKEPLARCQLLLVSVDDEGRDDEGGAGRERVRVCKSIDTVLITVIRKLSITPYLVKYQCIIFVVPCSVNYRFTVLIEATVIIQLPIVYRTHDEVVLQRADDVGHGGEEAERLGDQRLTIDRRSKIRQ